MSRMPAQMTLSAGSGRAGQAGVCDGLAPKTKRTQKTRPVVPGNRGL